MPSVVTLGSGYELTVKPISARLLEQYDLAHKVPEPPLREAEAIGGVKEMLPDYEDAGYLQAKAEYDSKSVNDLLGMIIEFGLDVELPQDDSWLRKLHKIGIEVAEDDLKSAYVQYILMSDFLSDIKIVVKAVLTQSGVTEEAIASWAVLF